MVQRRAVLSPGSGGAKVDDGNEDAATVDGGGWRRQLDPAGGAEARHVYGALATQQERLRVLPPLALPDVGVKQFVVTLTTQSATIGGADRDLIQIVTPEAAAPSNSLGAGIATAPSPRGFLDPDWLSTRIAADVEAVALEAGPMTCPDPASIAGAAVVMIGHTALILSSWPIRGP